MGLLLIFVTFCTDLIFALRLIGLINDPIYEFQKKKVRGHHKTTDSESQPCDHLKSTLLISICRSCETGCLQFRYP